MATTLSAWKLSIFVFKSIQIFNVRVKHFDIGVEIVITGVAGFFQHKARGN
jgi:hypothetical protein